MRTDSVLHLSACIFSMSEHRTVDTHGGLLKYTYFKYVHLQKYIYFYFLFLANLPCCSNTLNKQERNLLPKDLTSGFVYFILFFLKEYRSIGEIGDNKDRNTRPGKQIKLPSSELRLSREPARLPRPSPAAGATPEHGIAPFLKAPSPGSSSQTHSQNHLEKLSLLSFLY